MKSKREKRRWAKKKKTRIATDQMGEQKVECDEEEAANLKSDDRKWVDEKGAEEREGEQYFHLVDTAIICRSNTYNI